MNGIREIGGCVFILSVLLWCSGPGLANGGDLDALRQSILSRVEEANCAQAEAVSRDLVELARRTQNAAPPEAAAAGLYLAQCTMAGPTAGPDRSGGIFGGAFQRTQNLVLALNSLQRMARGFVGENPELRGEEGAASQALGEFLLYLELGTFTVDQRAAYDRVRSNPGASHSAADRRAHSAIRLWRNGDLRATGSER